jgi:hypothetical protein
MAITKNNNLAGGDTLTKKQIKKTVPAITAPIPNSPIRTIVIQPIKLTVINRSCDSINVYQS